MAKIVEVQHTGGGSLRYRFKGTPRTLEKEGDRGFMPEDLYAQHRDKLILVSDLHFLKVSPDYKGEPKQFTKPRPLNPLAQRAVELVEKESAKVDDGAEALKAKLKELEAEWIGKTEPEVYIVRYGKDAKKTALANKIIEIKQLLAEAEITDG